MINETKLAIGRLIVAAVEWDYCRKPRFRDSKAEKRLHEDAKEIRRLSGFNTAADLDILLNFIRREVGDPVQSEPL